MKLFNNSIANFSIIYSSNAKALDNQAVSEMALFIRRCEGGDIRAYPFKPTYNYENYMCISADDSVLESFGVKVPREKFTDDTVYILIKDNVVVLDGGARGRLYAVYEFVERFMGVRFYLPEVTKTPKVTNLEIADQEIIYTPSIRFRNLYSYDMRRDRDFCIRHRMNTENDPLNMENYGGSAGWAKPDCHTTFQNLLPPEDPEYGFEKHPEYFSYIEAQGKRVARRHFDYGFKWGEGEICWTHPEVIDILTERVKQWVLNEPRMRIFSITQNDYANYCECPKCKEIAYKYGKDGQPRWGAPIVWSVNEIARRIKDWQQTDERVKNREILLETFAYLYGVEPPIGLQAEDNVIIRMTMGFCWLHKIDDENCPYNKQLKRRFEGWQKLTKNLYVWSYPQNHAWYIAYNAVLHGFRSHIKYLADNQIMGVFEEMGSIGRIGPLFPVKQYMYARLTWNPNIDFESEYKECMEYFYGDSAPYLMEIERRYIEMAQGIQDYHPHNSHTILKIHYTDEFLETATSIFEVALTKAKTARHKLAVRREYAWLKWTKMYLRRGKDYAEMQSVIDEFDELEIYFPKVEMFKKHYYGGKKNDWFLTEIEERNLKNEYNRLQELTVLVGD